MNGGSIVSQFVKNFRLCGRGCLLHAGRCRDSLRCCRRPSHKVLSSTHITSLLDVVGLLRCLVRVISFLVKEEQETMKRSICVFTLHYDSLEFCRKVEDICKRLDVNRQCDLWHQQRFLLSPWRAVTSDQ